jgi:hypothetical protein
MKLNNKNRVLINLITIGILYWISNRLVIKTTIEDFSILSSKNLFAYFGVLIGFSLTVYTFGLSMVSDIKSSIEKLDYIDESKKNKMYDSLIMGFKEIKQDIWLIFFALLAVIYFAIAKEVTNPFGWDVERFKIPESSNLTMFFVTTLSMFDIMRTLFNLAEIKLELIKNNKASG